MGSAHPDIKDDCSLEDFISKWEKSFFGSYFSHTRLESSPLKANFVQFWNTHMQSGTEFPLELLKRNPVTVKQLCHEQ